MRMADVVDEQLWKSRVDSFKRFAQSINAEYEYRILENGKECCVVKQFYKPKKEAQSGN